MVKIRITIVTIAIIIAIITIIDLISGTLFWSRAKRYSPRRHALRPERSVQAR